MPLYEYACPACGVFEASRPMAQATLPDKCPRFPVCIVAWGAEGR